MELGVWRYFLEEILGGDSQRSFLLFILPHEKQIFHDQEFLHFHVFLAVLGVVPIYLKSLLNMTYSKRTSLTLTIFSRILNNDYEDLN